MANSKLPTISIVMPSLNQGRFLGEALESIFRQDYPRLEVVVMDGGSSDDSVAIIRSFAPKLAFWQSQPDDGQADAINSGMRRCHGDLVAWLNADDGYFGNALWIVGNAHAAHPGRGLYIGNGFRLDQATGRLSPFCQRHVVLNRTALIHGLDYLLQPSVFFLRRAWEEAGGLDPTLHYCLDWDLFIRIARKHPAVLINEFLAFSREYDDTKTSRGKLRRAFEIGRMVQTHSGRELTPGSMYYLLQTLLDVTRDGPLEAVRQQLHTAMNQVGEQFAVSYGHRDGFPEQGDPQDTIYLPLATADAAPVQPPLPPTHPRISVVVPSFNQAQFLGRTLASVANQDYLGVELMVFDGGSTDGSVELLKQHEGLLTYWESERDRGPAHAINKGFARATGEVLSWLNSDDLLAADTLSEVGRTFAEDPDLDMVYANALYIDENDRPYLVDHGTQRTALYRGEIQPRDRIPAYWSYVHAVPQPTVFFRRRLLQQCGPLNESCHYIFDFELFWRFTATAKIKKIERTLAFYRIHSQSKSSDWNSFLIELYRFSRRLWPPLLSPRFRGTARDFLVSYMQRRYGHRRHDLRFWATAALVGLSVVTRIGNPEAFPRRRAQRGRQPSSPQSAPATRIAATPARPTVARANNGARPAYRSLFHSYLWPRHPGYFGGEIRDFYLVRHLLGLSALEFFASSTAPPDGREDANAAQLDMLHTPESLPPELFDALGARPQLLSRYAGALRRLGVPVLGPRYHFDPIDKLPQIRAFSRNVIQAALARQPDFFFVSPQTNPVALTLDLRACSTRLIMASYDVEAVRMQRLADAAHGFDRTALQLEARRATRFERDNLARYDGVIAVSDIDKLTFQQRYGFDAERVLVVVNAVDTEFFAFQERSEGTQLHIVFVGSLSYRPNRQAAWRLVRRIMPLVWAQYPAARLCLVGHGAEPALQAQHDGTRIEVTGLVPDVRPWLAGAALACVPLESGSGTKYKILEALSAGVPVVCTRLALEGLNLTADEHVLVGDSDAELAAAICKVLASPDAGGEMARRGRTHIENHYTWAAALTPLADWLAHIRALPHHWTKP